MAATWTIANLQTGATLAASTASVSAWADFTSAYEASISGQITNQASAPTTPPTLQVDLSPDNGVTIYSGAGGIVQGGSGARATFAYQFPGLEGWYARTNFSGALGNSVNIVADSAKLTGI